jgi:hypothetical protein
MAGRRFDRVARYLSWVLKLLDALEQFQCGWHWLPKQGSCQRRASRKEVQSQQDELDGCTGDVLLDLPVSENCIRKTIERV